MPMAAGRVHERRYDKMHMLGAQGRVIDLVRGIIENVWGKSIGAVLWTCYEHNPGITEAKS